MVRKTRDLISIIFLSLVSLLSLSFCIGLLLTNASLRRSAEAGRSELEAIEANGYYTTARAEQLVEKAQNDARLDAENQIRDHFKSVLEEKGALPAIRELYPEDVIVASQGSYHFYSIDENIEKNIVYGENFTADDNGILKYCGTNEDFSSKLGVAVSRYQGEIDFEKVRDAGVSFVMIRAGLSGSSEGGFLEDDYFADNIKMARQAGLEVGIYFESAAINEEEAAEEAEFVLDIISPYEISYPVAILIEPAESNDERTAGLRSFDYTAITDAFCDRIEEAGYVSMVYGNMVSFTELLDNSVTQKRALWVSCIADRMYYPYQMDLWEYTRNGRIDGISGGAVLLMDASGAYGE